MKFCWLFVGGLAAQVSAYSIPGGYERFLFWYAYQIDGLSKRDTIAAGCQKWSQQNRRCNFNELCDYISNNNRGTTNVVADPDVNDLDRWARALNSAGSTGQYTAKRIMNTDSSDVSKLWIRVGEFIKDQVLASVNDPDKMENLAALADNARLAGQRVEFHRNLASSESAIDALRNRWPNIPISSIGERSDPGMPEEGRFILYKETLKAASSAGLSGFSESAFESVYNNAVDANHIKMRLAINEAVDYIFKGIYNVDVKLQKTTICMRT